MCAIKVLSGVNGFYREFSTKHKYIDTWLASGIGLKNEAHQCYKELGYEITVLINATKFLHHTTVLSLKFP